ncbi:unnamed protein product [Closterium sp. NIES-53]
MATPRVLRFDAEGRPLEFSVWLLHARRLLESQVQAHETLWAHASGDLPEPADPAPLAADPTLADSDRYARERAVVTAWKSRDAAVCIALSSLLLESEETHFTQVRTASEFLTAIKARYATPTTVSLGHLFLPFLFPDLTSFERSADAITHLCSVDSSYRAACTDAQLALLPPPMAITIFFIATSLPDRLASVRDALLLKHPSELTIEVPESALKDVESNLRSVAFASGAVPPSLFHGRGGQGAGGGGGGDVASGGGGSVGVGGAPRAAAGDSPAAAGGGDARVRQPPTGPPAAGGGAAVWSAAAAAAAASAAAAAASAAAAAAAAAVVATSAASVAAPAVAAIACDPCHCPLSGSCLSPGCRVSPGSCVWSGLPRVLPSLPPSIAPPCGPCVEGRLRATPHSSSLRPTTEPFETLHLDVWGPASRPGPERESFFLVVVDDYSRYTTVFPLANKSDVNSTLIRWLLTIADTRGQVSPTSRWTGSPGAASHFRVWVCLTLVRDTSADKISPRAAPCVFLGFPEDSLATPFTTLPFTGSLTLVTSVSTSPSPITSANPAGAGFHGKEPGGASSRGAGVGAESVPVRGPGSGGAGVGAEPGATTGGAPSAGPGELGTDPVTFGGAGSGGGAAGSLESDPRATTTPDITPPPHPYPTRHQAPARGAAAAAGARAAAVAGAAAAAAAGGAVVAAAAGAAASSSSCLYSCPSSSAPLSPLLSHTWPLRRSHRARPSSPVPLTVLRTALFRYSPPHSSPSVLPSPPESALTASLSTPVTDYYRTYRPSLSLPLLAALTTPPVLWLLLLPLAVGGESAIGCDALEDRHFELDFLAAASPHICAMLLAPEGEPDALDIPTSRTYVEAVSGPWASQWRDAMDSEMASYRSTGTYVDKVPPPRANVVDDMWIFKVKRPSGSPPIFKARYVAKDFSQREGVDFLQTFAPTPKMTTLRVLLHVVAQRDYDLHSLDFSTAFLQGSLHEEPSSADPSLFFCRGSTLFFVLVYVDDLVFATADRVTLADVKLELQKRHTCTDLGELRHYLGLQITRDRAARTITLSQSHMVQQILQRFELQHSTVQRTPLAVDHRLTGPFPSEPFEPSGPYAELVGWLIYLMTSTTSGMGLVLGGRQDIVLTGHCDSSYVDDAEMHRSTQGYCFSLGSGAILWRFTRSSSILTSTAEAEMYTRAIAAQELRWLTFLLIDLGERPSPAPTLFTDNKRHGQTRFNFVESEANTQTSSPRPCCLVTTRGVVYSYVSFVSL